MENSTFLKTLPNLTFKTQDGEMSVLSAGDPPCEKQKGVRSKKVVKALKVKGKENKNYICEYCDKLFSVMILLR